MIVFFLSEIYEVSCDLVLMFNFLELSHPLQTIFHTHGCNLLQDPNNDEFLLNLFADLKSFDEICDRMLLHLVRKLHVHHV